MMVIVAVALVLVLGVGGFLFLSKSKGGKKAKPKVELTEWKLEDLMVTLADADELHYLKIGLTFEIENTGDGKAKKGGEGEAAENPEQAKALDVINMVLSSKKMNELLPEEGKTKLKEELKTKLNDELEQSKIHEVYFTYFAVQ